jgi:hypothetical protein
MKTNKSYTLNENLELKNENFIVKKGTGVTVTNLYNKTDMTIPTVLGVKFDNINGNYHFNETEFKTLLDNNALTPQPNHKYNNGDRVKLSNGVCGTVESATYYTLGGWLYEVNGDDGNNYKDFEKNISKC